MGDENTIRAIQFGQTVALLAQQKESRLRNAVTVKTGVVGKMTTMDQVAARTAKRKTSRFASLNIEEVDYRRRAIFPVTAYDNPGIDPDDDLNWVADPTASLVQSVAAGIARDMDDEILDNATASANTGEDGTTSTALPAGQKVAAASTMLTLAKLRSAKKILDQNEVDSDNRFLVANARQIDNLLGDTNVTSSDFNTVKALVMGDVNAYVGFTFIRSERINLDSNSDDQVLAFHKTGVGLAIWKEITSRIDERQDMHYAKQIYFSMRFGSQRLEEEKLVEVACNTS